MWRRSARVYFRLSAEVRGLKPGTNAHHQLFHCCFFARTGKSPKLQVAGANFQEGKAQKRSLVVCFYQRIPQFDAQ